MVAALATAQDTQLDIDQEEVSTSDIDDCYLSLNVEDFRAALPDDYNALNILNEIRRASRELVSAGVRNIQFGESARKGDTLVLGIRDLERDRLTAFLKSVGINVAEEDTAQGVEWGNELRASLERREVRRQARNGEYLARQREHVARFSVRKELGRPYDIEFVDNEKTKFIVVDEIGTRTLYVGEISERPTFTGFEVKICKAKLIVESDGQVFYKGRAAVIFKGKVRDILEGAGADD